MTNPKYQRDLEETHWAMKDPLQAKQSADTLPKENLASLSATILHNMRTKTKEREATFLDSMWMSLIIPLQSQKPHCQRGCC